MLVEILLSFVSAYIKGFLPNSVDNSWSDFITRTTGRAFLTRHLPFYCNFLFCKKYGMVILCKGNKNPGLSYATLKNLQYGRKVVSVEWVLLFGGNAQCVPPHRLPCNIQKSFWLECPEELPLQRGAPGACVW